MSAIVVVVGEVAGDVLPGLPAVLLFGHFEFPRTGHRPPDVEVRPLCVSAETSFGLAGILIPVGGYCLAAAGQRDRFTLPLAAVPLLFGIQQTFEGLVWVGIGRENAELTQPAALAYLFFALAFWLFWIPLSAVFLESKRTIRFVLGISALLGFAGRLAFYSPILWNPEVLVVSVDHHSIRYDFARSPALQAIPQRLAARLPGHRFTAAFGCGPAEEGIDRAEYLARRLGGDQPHLFLVRIHVRVVSFAALLSLIITCEFHRLPSVMSGRLGAPPIESLPKPTVPG